MKVSLAKGALFGLGGTGVLSAGGYLAWRSQQPTDVKSRLVWEGLSVADSKTLGVYKALYLANHTKAGFSSFITSKSKEEATPLLKAKCDELLGVGVSSYKYEESLEKARKWCLVPEKETIEISLLFEDAVFSSSDDDYKNTFALNRSSQDFINIIKNEDTSLSISSDVALGFPKLKTWCEVVIKKKPIDADLKNAKAWCLRGPLDIKEQLAKDGLTMIREGKWQDRYIKHKEDSTFLQEIKASPAPQQDSKGGVKLQTWCNEKVEMKLHNNDYINTYDKVKRYCTNN